ncbi:MAG: transglycosylase domain-containing protein [Deltaproteobacteria bacterium]|nr:transglycosylase domain-containing protein [Deltaproteobacteria bacterium]
MVKKTFKISVYIILPVIIIAAVIFALIYTRVSKETLSHIERGAIDQIILSESPVYFDDGTTPIGVFFEKTHSKYIRYDEIPRNFIKALIASEDKNFFQHPGFDIRAIARAFITNIKEGEIVQGGSTLTQQTAKNIFKREKRTYTAKLKELIQALLLERNYSKEEIIEMYANQFFVTGFGKGLRIAAEYYFNKDAEELDLVEAAFIAGSVKSPSTYNPFPKKNDTEKEAVIRRAKIRKDYVLRQMRLMELISEHQYIDALKKEVPFNEGTVTYRLNVIMDYVREQLETAYFRTILRDQGVENIATSGIGIHTSINKEIQDAALKSLRYHLSNLDVRIAGYGVNEFRDRYRRHSGADFDVPGDDIPFFARVSQIISDIEKPAIVVSWDNGGGVIGYEGMKDVAESWLKWKIGGWARLEKKNVTDFLKLLHVDDVVPVQLQDNEGDGEDQRLILSVIPELEGGVVVLNKGMVRGLVGGYFNRYFNRASDARRQLGSIFKPLVYTAAVQLKWNNLDTLPNKRDIFSFEDTLYFPRPDHEPKSDKVSMTWAGAKSENLATVWLLYHLTDNLNQSEFRQVVELLGLHRQATEDYQEYIQRIRDRYGVIVDRDALLEAAFLKAKKDIEPDLIFSGLDEILDRISSLHYDVGERTPMISEEEYATIARLSFARLQAQNTRMINKFNDFKHLIDFYNKNDTEYFNSVNEAMDDFYYIAASGGKGRIVYSENPNNLESFEDLLPDPVSLQSKGPLPDDVWIDNIIPSGVISLIQERIKENYGEFLKHKRYDPEVLYSTRDFRTLVNLIYVKCLAEKMGIFTELEPVLSFPLGANSISILEAAVAYNSMMVSSLYRYRDDTGPPYTPVILKIVDRNGEILWEYRPHKEKVISEMVSSEIKEILRHVIENGTGRAAAGNVQILKDFESGELSFPVPAFGKTGTSNNFTNSSFVGFIPGMKTDSGKFSFDNGYVIAGYVGYDDNRPLKGGQTTIYGASGALPLWIDVANIIVNSREYTENIQLADLAFANQTTAIHDDERLIAIKVHPVTGLPVAGSGRHFNGDSPEIYSHAGWNDDRLHPLRYFEPFQGVEYE